MTIYAASNTNTNWVAQGLLGTRFDTVGPDATHAVGQRAFGKNGAEFIYVGPATAALGQYNVLWINSSFVPANITDALAKTPGFVGFSQVAFTTSDYGWVAISGKVTINCPVNTNANVPLYTCNTAGFLDDATVSGSSPEILGVRLITSNGTTTAGSAVANNVTVRFPH